MKQAVQNMLPDQDPDMPVSIDKPGSVYFVYTDEGAVKEDADPNAQRRARLRSAKRPGTAGKKGKRPGSARPESAAAKRAAK
mmetsp:Transcript_31882/g.5766  ORF Transcript_31882/g.5766 Transcript_31882/m.5766 type:complete len:82 (+) Transcript_31882:1950-2195(+)